MRNQRNTLLAGIAALALLAGTSFVSAQETQDHNGAPQTKQPQATQQMKMNKAPVAGKMDKSAQQQKSESTVQKSARTNSETKAAASTKHMAQTERRKPAKHGAMARTEKPKAGKMAQQRSHMGRQNAAQQHNRMQERQNTAQTERNGMKGLQGNASGMNVQLSNEQREQIRTTVLNGRGAPRVGNVNFDVTVGTAIPHGFRVVPVPGTLVQFEPQWRGFLYFVWNDEIVIVNPRDMRIVAVMYV